MTQLPVEQAMQAGIRHHETGQLRQAEAVYRQVLQQYPFHAEAAHLLGLIAEQTGHHAEAIALMTRSLACGNSRNAVCHNNLGEAYRRTGNNERALASYRTALQLDPTMAVAYSNIGATLISMGKVDEATEALTKALQVNPTLPEALNNLGNVLTGQAKFAEAIEYYRRALAARPTFADAHNNLGAALEQSNDLPAAEASYRRAVELDPSSAEAMHNLGTALQQQGRMHEAVEWWQRAVKVRPDYADGWRNLSLAYLNLGDYERGWELHEWRTVCAPPNPSKEQLKDKPVWDGSPLNGKTILVFPEQGFGDAVQFARFVPQVAARGGRVLLGCYDSLAGLMRTVEGVTEVIPSGSHVVPFDTHISIMSLPWRLGTTLDNLPNRVPYLWADPARVEWWRAFLADLPAPELPPDAPPDAPPARRMKIGVAWAGRPEFTRDRDRTMPLRDLLPLRSLPGVTVVSLQKGDAARQVAELADEWPIVDVADRLTDFSETAALIANLDLVIAVDTAVVHLAGALAKPVWTLLPFAPDWRWLLEREDCPWYPTMRLFRQRRRRDWPEVVERVRQELLKQLQPPQ